MSKHDGVVYCDFISCHLVIVPADRSQVNFLKANYHGPCYLAELRAQKQATYSRGGLVNTAKEVRTGTTRGPEGLC